MKLEKSGPIWVNGKLVPWDDAKVHVLTHGLHYASSVFEGLRAYDTPAGPAVMRLSEHMERLLFSCRVARMPIKYTLEELVEGVLETVRASGLESCYIRPIVFRGYAQLGVNPSGCPVETVIAVWPLGGYFGEAKRQDGISLGVSSWRRMAPDTLPAMVKAAANYFDSQMIVLEAKRHGYDDGIALDVDGFVSEASGANLFVVHKGRLITPPVSSSILLGITRESVVTLAEEAGIEVIKESLPREMLHAADEVFVTGTAAEVTHVNAIDGLPVGDGKCGPLTARLREAFRAIVSGQVPDRHGWLTLAAARTPA